jgi:DNA mismatch endonuclease (patch repair protein)
VLPRWRVAIFVNGCFWHRHSCSAGRVPETRREFWLPKLEANAVRDRRAQDALIAAGWRVLVVWECALRRSRASRDQVLAQALDFIQGSDEPFRELPEI